MSYLKEGLKSPTGHPLYSGRNDEKEKLFQMRDNICFYGQILDTYAPCIVGYSNWNNDIKMEAFCATTDRKLWNEKIITISDEAFILVCLMGYGKRWFAEHIKAEKQVRQHLIRDKQHY